MSRCAHASPLPSTFATLTIYILPYLYLASTLPLPSQLCINYANEALQHFFIQCTFQAEELLHHEEGVTWQPVWYPDNRDVLDLLGKSPSGLFYILDAVCRTPQATDTTFHTQLLQVHGGSPLLSPPAVDHNSREKTAARGTPARGTPARGGNGRGVGPLRQDEGFVLKHFAGDVEYQVAGFLRKSAERLPPELEAMLLETPTSVARTVLVDHLPLPAIGADLDVGLLPPGSPDIGSRGGHLAFGHPRQYTTKPLQRLGGGGTVGRQFVGVVRALMTELSEVSGALFSGRTQQLTCHSRCSLATARCSLLAFALLAAPLNSSSFLLRSLLRSVHWTERAEPAESVRRAACASATSRLRHLSHAPNDACCPPHADIVQ